MSSLGEGSTGRRETEMNNNSRPKSALLWQVALSLLCILTILTRNIIQSDKLLIYVGWRHTTKSVPMSRNESQFSIALQIYFIADQGIRLCRFHKACLGQDGEIIIHENWKDKEKELYNDCHLSRIEYKNQSWPFDSESETSDLDVLGTVTTSQMKDFNYGHQPHFVQKSLPAYYISQLMNSNRNKSKSIIPIECRLSNGNTCSIDLSEPGHRLRLAFFVPDLVWGLSKSSWVHQYLKLMPGSPEPLSRKALFKSNAGIQCFKSVLTYPISLGKITPSWTTQGEPREKLHLQTNESCSINIGIINRNTLRNRNILNILQLTSKIRIRMKQLGQMVNFHILSKISIIYFEKMSLPEQRNAISQADIVVGPHGAGLTNIIFARKHTPVLEIFPYYYYYALFQHFARIFSLNYTFMVAEPHKSSFLNCVMKWREELVDESLAFWNETMRIYLNSTNPMEKQPVPPSMEHIAFQVRHCIRDQSLNVNEDFVSRWTTEMVCAICSNQMCPQNPSNNLLARKEFLR